MVVRCGWRCSAIPILAAAHHIALVGWCRAIYLREIQIFSVPLCTILHTPGLMSKKMSLTCKTSSYATLFGRRQMLEVCASDRSVCSSANTEGHLQEHSLTFFGTLTTRTVSHNSRNDKPLTTIGTKEQEPKDASDASTRTLMKHSLTHCNDILPKHCFLLANITVHNSATPTLRTAMKET